MPSVHAVLSASGAHRWIACPPSARLEERYHGIFGDVSSSFAAEGTQAHSLAELKLQRQLWSLTDGDEGINQFNFQARVKALGNIPPEMDKATEYYADLVIEKYLTVRKTCPDAKLFIEQRLDFSEWVPQGFGTGDAVIISDTLCEVCDLKYGKGVPVSAIDNPQARCYGLGALQAYGHLYDFTHVRNTIIQPRLDSVTEETLTTEELLTWADTVLKPAAELAWSGEGDFNPGPHCKFCAARALCYARALQAMNVFKDIFAKPDSIPYEQIPDILAVADGAIDWLKELQAFALQQALRGEEWRGYKLVHGRRPPRKWLSEEKTEEQLIRAGYKPEDYKVTTLKSVSQIEKLVGAQAFKAIFEDMTTQSDGALTLVPEDDPRLEYSSADADFSDLLTTDNN